ncbi:MAG TPA: MmcQ/YjbR family DNA-binding protein [Asticcacaulis sp.]|nr:MmcQ/YjbR family DNA-binding protein [Asticcacaulis sp.]
MVDSAQTRSIALALPGVTDESTPDRLIFCHSERGIAWTFMQRDTPRQPRRPNIEVLAVSCTLDRKELLIEASPDAFFDDPHYRGYPAVLVRLPVIDATTLSELFGEACAWAASRPKKKKR